MKTFTVTLLVIVFTAEYLQCSCLDSDITFLGCFEPGNFISFRYQRDFFSSFRLADCVAMCRRQECRYLGADQRHDSCWCGYDIAFDSQPRADDLCDNPCKGDGVSINKTCGNKGGLLLSIYDLEANVISESVGDVTNVTFLVGTPIGLRMINTTTPDSFLTITNSTNSVKSVDYHLGRNLVYFYSNGDLYKSKSDPKTNLVSATPIHVKKMSGCEGFAVDWIHNAIYWMDCSTNSLKLMDLEGNNVTIITKLPGDEKMVKRMEVDPKLGKVFWVADGTLESCDATGENFRTNLSVPGVDIRAVTLDIETRRVFYVGIFIHEGNPITNLYDMSYDPQGTSSATISLRSPQIQSAYGLNVLKEYLYWANSRFIYRQPLNVTGDRLIVGQTNRAVWHMKVVDPDLQRTYSGDPCLHTNCSHFCVHQRGEPRCLCPDGMTLDDNTTCSSPV